MSGPVMRDRMRATIGNFSSASRTLVQPSLFLLVAAAFANVTGFLYWLVAGNRFSSSDVGVMSSAVAVMSISAVLSAAGAGPVLLRALPVAGRRAVPVLRRTLLGTGVAASVAALGITMIVSRVSDQLEQLASVRMSALLMLGAALTAWTFAIDAVLVVGRRSAHIVIRQLVAGGSKVVLVLVATGMGAPVQVLLGAWVLALASAVAVNLLMVRSATVLVSAREERPYPPLRRSFVANHVATLTGQAPSLLFPLLVSTFVSTAASGVFYVVWALSAAVFLISPLIANVTLSELSGESGRQRDLVRRAGLLTGGLLLVPVVAAPWYADRLLSLLGDQYSGATVLFVLVAASAVPDAIVNITSAVLRSRDRLWSVVMLQAVSSTVALTVTCALLGSLGFVAVGWGWLSGRTLAATLIGVVQVRNAARSRHLP